MKKYVEETLERKRSHRKYVPALPSLEQDQKPGTPRRAQLDPGTVLSPFKYWGLFIVATLRKASNMLCSAYLAVWAKIPIFR